MSDPSLLARLVQQIDLIYALFDGHKQIGQPFPTEMEVWEHAVKEGLVEDIPVADEAGGRVLPMDTTSRR